MTHTENLDSGEYFGILLQQYFIQMFYIIRSFDFSIHHFSLFHTGKTESSRRKRRDLSPMTYGRDGCRGVLAIVYSSTSDPYGSTYIRTFRPTNYRNTKRVFRRRCIVRVEVWGTCSWRLYEHTSFRGRYVSLSPGVNSYITVLPRSIAQM